MLSVIKKVIVFYFALIVVGCATYSTNKSNFTQMKLEELPSGIRLVICRPSSIYQADRRPDVYIDNEFAHYIGSGEVLYFDMKKKDKVDLRIELMGYGTQFEPGTNMILNIKPNLRNQDNYFLLAINFNDILPSTDNSSLGTISSEWSLRSINKPQFEDKCGKLKTAAFSPKNTDMQK
jgi:hypothetical protein